MDFLLRTFFRIIYISSFLSEVFEIFWQASYLTSFSTRTKRNISRLGESRLFLTQIVSPLRKASKELYMEANIISLTMSGSDGSWRMKYFLFLTVLLEKLFSLFFPSLDNYWIVFSRIWWFKFLSEDFFFFSLSRIWQFENFTLL